MRVPPPADEPPSLCHFLGMMMSDAPERLVEELTGNSPVPQPLGP